MINPTQPRTAVQRLQPLLIFALGLALVSGDSQANISCPPMPEAVTAVNRDIKSEISASVGSLGRIKAGDISVKTEVQANNIFAKYPNVDKLLALQTMSATYCEMLARATIPENEKLNRWEKFQDKVLDLKAGVGQAKSLPAPAVAPARKTGGQTKTAARPINAKGYPLLVGMRVGLMYIERESRYMAEVKGRLMKVGAMVTTNDVADWRAYPEYVGRLLFNPSNLAAATQLKALVEDVSAVRLSETREIFDKYDLIIWMDPIK